MKRAVCHLSPWASMSTDLSVEFHGVGLALGESGVILSVPSRFEGAGDGGNEHRFFWRRAAKKNGAQLLQRVCDRQTICMRKLGDDRAEKVRFQRFVLNDRVTAAKIAASQRPLIAKAAAGQHVLGIQDTSEINYESQRGRKRGLGTVGNGSDIGLFAHPRRGGEAGTKPRPGMLDLQRWRSLQSRETTNA